MSAPAWWRACLCTASFAWACAAQAHDFVTIAPAACTPVEQGMGLPADMAAYRAAVKVCPLAQPTAPHTAQAQVRLLSVFTDDYYKALPADAPWQNFPLPMLIDATGRCLGRIGHLFPADPPQELTISAGRWQRGIPHELRLKVRSPAVGGDATLPSLHWNARSGGYAAKNTHPSQDKTSCPPT
ncbi:hypothetical protein [Acidovorax sp. LjRoot117]|uniref:hypothetical protein n=1 Tax=Acidovorax sp. LjRoot117 TaxID=3342255 RepID=UPI003ECF13E3